MTKKNILVTGDYIIDHHVYEGQRLHYAQSTKLGVKLIPEMGGAALVHKLLKELLSGNKHGWASHLAVKDSLQMKKVFGLNKAEHAYAFWRPFPRNASPDRQFWRISEPMGFGFDEGEQQCLKWPAASDMPKCPEIMIISEGGMGFRDCPEDWQKERLESARWIVLKTTSPVGCGELWTYLTSEYSDKLIVIVSAQELRKSPARMNTGLSWEETIDGLLRELGQGGELESLTMCRHLIVTFESEGAVWMDLRKGFPNSNGCLIYDSGTIEGDQANETEGKAFGFLSCLAASISWQLTLDTEKPDLAAALEGGLSAMRDLREKGHGPVKDKPYGFPSKRLAENIKNTMFSYSRALFMTSDLPAGKMSNSPSKWSFLGLAQRSKSPAYDLARLILLRGPIALKSLPHISIGALLTADRFEVEDFRILSQAIRRYKEKDSGKKPLSIGVFGPPGAGKSFAVRELSKKLIDGDRWMEFNLSQFDNPEDLNGAFHQIRDHVLQGQGQGQLPIAFFDEFDSHNYKWLQYLLAPMQDGKFQEGQLTHTLGKCIFIFAGGTSPRYDSFGPLKPLKNESESEVYREFRLAKGPDFISRLDAYLNVLGPNQRQIPAPKGNKAAVEKICGRDFVIDSSDIVFPVRRALMIRAQLKCATDDKLQMDEGLVHALLHVGKYTHGNRSLEKILQPFVGIPKDSFHSSLLMPLSQIAMYTDEKEFMSLCASAPKPFSPDAPLTKQQIEKIAPAISETYRALGKKEGWIKPDTDKDFKNLSPFFQESNRAAAERMLWLLGLAGLTLAEGAANQSEENEIKQHLEYYMTALAEAEHEGWMKWHLEQGWNYDPIRKDEKKQHNCLVPFSKLQDKDKHKDRESIRHYPEFAREAGMKIVFVQQ